MIEFLQRSSSNLTLLGPHTGRFTGHADAEETPWGFGTPSACYTNSILNVNTRLAVTSEVAEWPKERLEVEVEKSGWILTHSIDVIRCKPYSRQRKIIKRLSILAQENAQPAPSLSAEEKPVPPAPDINSFNHGGSGCPPGTITSTLTPVNSTLGTYALTHTLTGLRLNGSSKVGSRKNCQLAVSISLPMQWQYKINKDGLAVAGYVWLPDARRRLEAKASYFWPNDGTVSLALTYKKIKTPNTKADMFKSSPHPRS